MYYTIFYVAIDMKSIFSNLISYLGGKKPQETPTVIDFQKHDARKHGGYFDPETMTCKLREQNPELAAKYDGSKKLAEQADIDTDKALNQEPPILEGGAQPQFEHEEPKTISKPPEPNAIRRYQQMYNTVGVAEFPRNIESLKRIKFLEGSTGPMLMQDENGKKWVVKEGASDGQSQAEFEADEAYRALGINVPASMMIDGHRVSEFIEGKPLGEWLETASPDDKKKVLEEIRAGFAADAIFGNKDVVGLVKDNILVTPEGHAFRIDNGGSLGYRAQGEPDKRFGAYPDELFSMRNSAPTYAGKPDREYSVGEIFGSLSELDVAWQIQDMDWDAALSKMSPERRDKVLARVNNAREFAFYATNANQAGYTDDTANAIGRLSYGLMKTSFAADASKAYTEWEHSYEATASLGGMTVPPDSAKKLRDILVGYGEQVGVDYALLDKAIENQGLASLPSLTEVRSHYDAPHESCIVMKIAELSCMGITRGEFAAKDYSRITTPDGDGICEMRLVDQMEFLNSRLTDEQFSNIKGSHLLRKTATMMFLRNTYSNLLNQDGTMTVGRSEAGSAMPAGVKDGDNVRYKKDPVASYTYHYIKHYTSGPKAKIVSNVPLARCTMIDFISGDGAGVNPYLGQGYDQTEMEFEVSVNAIGLEARVVAAPASSSAEGKKGLLRDIKKSQNYGNGSPLVPFNSNIPPPNEVEMRESKDDIDDAEMNDMFMNMALF